MPVTLYGPVKRALADGVRSVESCCWIPLASPLYFDFQQITSPEHKSCLAGQCGELSSTTANGPKLLHVRGAPRSCRNLLMAPWHGAARHSVSGIPESRAGSGALCFAPAWARKPNPCAHSFFPSHFPHSGGFFSHFPYQSRI